jgi:hypothetical protein
MIKFMIINFMIILGQKKTPQKGIFFDPKDLTIQIIIQLII